MFAKISPTSSPNMGTTTLQDPIARSGAPFDRDNVRWTPITIMIGSETCEIEALFDPKEPSNQPINEIVACPVKELKGMTAITRLGTNQVILCGPFEKLQKQPPGSFADFQNLVKSVMIALQPSASKVLESAIIEEKEVPNRALFSLQMCAAPTSVTTTDPVSVDEKGWTTRKTTEYNTSASLIRAYATNKALYILTDRSEDVLTNPHTQSFLSSFKIK